MEPISISIGACDASVSLSVISINIQMHTEDYYKTTAIIFNIPGSGGQYASLGAPQYDYKQPDPTAKFQIFDKKIKKGVDSL